MITTTTPLYPIPFPPMEPVHPAAAVQFQTDFCPHNDTVPRPLDLRRTADAVTHVDRNYNTINCLAGAMMVTSREWPPFVPSWLWCPDDNAQREDLLPYLDFFGWKPKEKLDRHKSLVMHRNGGRVFHFEVDFGDRQTFSKGLYRPSEWRPLTMGQDDLLFGRVKPSSSHSIPSLSGAFGLIGQGEISRGRAMLQAVQDSGMMSSEFIAERCFREGERFIKTGKLSLGEVTLWMALESQPNLAKAYLSLAKINIDLHKPTGSFHYARRVLQIDPQHRVALAIMGRSYLIVGTNLLNLENSEQKRRKLFLAVEDHIGQHTSLEAAAAHSLKESERYLLDAGPQHQEHLAEIWAHRGAALQQKDVPKAWRLVYKACRIDCKPDRQNLFISLTAKYVDQLRIGEDLVEAVKVCQRALTLMPSDGETKQNLLSTQMLCSSLQNRHKEAARFARRLWEQAPNANNLKNYLISARRAIRNFVEAAHYREAIEQLKEAIVIAPDALDLRRGEIFTHEQLGHSLIREGSSARRRAHRIKLEEEGYQQLGVSDQHRAQLRVGAPSTPGIFNGVSEVVAFLEAHPSHTNCFSGAVMATHKEIPPYLPPFFWPLDSSDVSTDLSLSLDLFGWTPTDSPGDGPLLITRSRDGKVNHVDACPDGVSGQMVTKLPNRAPQLSPCKTQEATAFYQQKSPGRLPRMGEIPQFVTDGKLYECRLVVEEKGAETAGSLVNLGRDFNAGGKADRAEACALLALTSDPNHMEAYRLLADLKTDAGKWPEPVYYASRLLELAPGDDAALHTAAKAFQGLGTVLLSAGYRTDPKEHLLFSTAPYLGEFADSAMAGLHAYERAVEIVSQTDSSDVTPIAESLARRSEEDPEYGWSISYPAFRRNPTDFRKNWLLKSARIYAEQLLDRGNRAEARIILDKALGSIPGEKSLVELRESLRRR
jgi:tetratricopeptide (TPR) repeat protein